MHTKSYGLDLLRIISSLLVFIPHIVISLSKDPALVKNSFIISILGVEIFFCLSGFLICKYGVSIIKSSKYMFLNSYVFVIRRVGRTWPAYFFALVSYIIFYRYYESEILYYILFLQNLNYPIVSETFFSVSWSICVEEIFYIIFPLLLCLTVLINRRYLKDYISSSLLIMITCFLIIIFVFFLRDNYNYAEWGSELRRVAVFRIDSIAFGGIGYFVFKYLKKITIVNITFFLLFPALLYFIYNQLNLYYENQNFTLVGIKNNLIFYIIYFFCLITIFLAEKIIYIKNNKLKKIISELANWSYPLYLMHILVIDLIKNLEIDNISINIILIFSLSFLISYLIRHYIEEPFIKIRPIFHK